jgi:hypothetical protein
VSRYRNEVVSAFACAVSKLFTYAETWIYHPAEIFADARGFCCSVSPRNLETGQCPAVSSLTESRLGRVCGYLLVRIRFCANRLTLRQGCIEVHGSKNACRELTKRGLVEILDLLISGRCGFVLVDPS